jgi:hypothetical protein
MNGRLLALLASAAIACNPSAAIPSTTANSNASPSVATYVPPSGCQMTLCDLVRTACPAPPPPPDGCTSCWNVCLANPADIDCPNECDSVCSEPTPATPTNACDTALDACRDTMKNAICVDDFTAPASSGQPCNDEVSDASCACAYDSACQSAIEEAAPACTTCSNEGLANQCASVCTAPIAAYSQCVGQNCTAGVDCDTKCFDAAKTANDCLWAVLEDPNDTTGCRAAEQACWTLPACNDDLTAEQ